MVTFTGSTAAIGDTSGAWNQVIASQSSRPISTAGQASRRPLHFARPASKAPNGTNEVRAIHARQGSPITSSFLRSWPIEPSQGEEEDSAGDDQIARASPQGDVERGPRG